MNSSVDFDTPLWDEIFDEGSTCLPKINWAPTATKNLLAQNKGKVIDIERFWMELTSNRHIDKIADG